MITIPSYIVKIGEAIWLRVTISLFFYLSLIFGRMFVSVGAHDYPHLTVVCGFLYEAVGIVLFNLLYGKYSVGRDINTLSFFGLICYAIYLPFYFAGADASEAHNNAAKILNVAIVIRCVYMTERDLFATFSPINIVKKWLLKRQWFVNSYINTLTVAVFAFLAVPLFTMMYFINTDEMRAAGIAVVLFAFYVAFENAKRAAPEETIAPDVESAGSDNTDFFHPENMLFGARLIYFGVVFCVLLGYAEFVETKEKFFNVGYASGYSDAKSGVAPKKEADFSKAVWCNMARMPGQPNPPGLSCDNPPKH
jgi:hypothetical protein